MFVGNPQPVEAEQSCLGAGNECPPPIYRPLRSIATNEFIHLSKE